MSDDNRTTVEVVINKFPEDIRGRILLGVTVGFGLTLGALGCIAFLSATAKLLRAVGII
jgi:hypothetical protein